MQSDVPKDADWVMKEVQETDSWPLMLKHKEQTIELQTHEQLHNILLGWYLK